MNSHHRQHSLHKIKGQFFAKTKIISQEVPIGGPVEHMQINLQNMGSIDCACWQLSLKLLTKLFLFSHKN